MTHPTPAAPRTRPAARLTLLALAATLGLGACADPTGPSCRHDPVPSAGPSRDACPAEALLSPRTF